MFQPRQTRSQPLVDQSQVLAVIWQRNLPVLRDRLARLDAAANESDLGQLLPAMRSEALDLAHKLAGCLGMFGYPQGTETARALEILLEADAPLPAGDLRRLTEQLRAQLPNLVPSANPNLD